MKDKEHGLLYHTLHSRPMPGCLPLFFVLALGMVALGLWLAPVKMPERVRPKGVGAVQVKDDRLTRFLLSRKSPLPLHLPHKADPEYQEDAAAAAMPLLRPVQMLTPPPLPVCSTVADSVVLSREMLLELPGDASVPAAAVDTAPPVPADEVPGVTEPEPVFHPGVEKEMDESGEEVPS